MPRNTATLAFIGGHRYSWDIASGDAHQYGANFSGPVSIGKTGNASQLY